MKRQKKTGAGYENCCETWRDYAKQRFLCSKCIFPIRFRSKLHGKFPFCLRDHRFILDELFVWWKMDRNESSVPRRDACGRQRETHGRKDMTLLGETSLFHLKRDQKPSNWKLEWWTSINFGGEKGRLGQEVNRKKRGLHIQEAVKVVRWKQLIRINLGTLVFEISFYNPVKSRIWYNFPLTEVYTKRYSHYCSFTKTTNSRVLLWSREEALFQNHQRSPWQKFCNMSGWRI